MLRSALVLVLCGVCCCDAVKPLVWQSTFTSSGKSDHNAVDGNLNTCTTLSPSGENASGSPKNIWWVLDFGQQHNFGVVRLLNQGKNCNTHMKNVHVDVSPTFSPSNVHQGLADDQGVIIPQLCSPGFDLDLRGKPGRYLMLMLPKPNTSDKLQICELQVFDTANNPGADIKYISPDGQATGTNPAPATGTGTNPAPNPAPATGTNPAPITDTTTGTNPAPATGTGTNPAPITDTTTGTNPAPATGTGTNPVPNPTPAIGTNPAPATGTGTNPVPNPTPAIGTNPTPATGTGTNPAPATGTGTNPAPNPAPATGTGTNPAPTTGRFNGNKNLASLCYAIELAQHRVKCELKSCSIGDHKAEGADAKRCRPCVRRWAWTWRRRSCEQNANKWIVVDLGEEVDISCLAIRGRQRIRNFDLMIGSTYNKQGATENTVRKSFKQCAFQRYANRKTCCQQGPVKGRYVAILKKNKKGKISEQDICRLMVYKRKQQCGASDRNLVTVSSNSPLVKKADLVKLNDGNIATCSVIKMPAVRQRKKKNRKRGRKARKHARRAKKARRTRKGKKSRRRGKREANAAEANIIPSIISVNLGSKKQVACVAYHFQGAADTDIKIFALAHFPKSVEEMNKCVKNHKLTTATSFQSSATQNTVCFNNEQGYVTARYIFLVQPKGAEMSLCDIQAFPKN